MKSIFISLMLFTSAAHAIEIQVSRMSKESQMERSFILKSNLASVLTLDCQSFVQGLYLGPRNQNEFLMLDPQECEDLYQRIKMSLRGKHKHCIEADEVIRSDYTCP